MGKDLDVSRLSFPRCKAKNIIMPYVKEERQLTENAMLICDSYTNGSNLLM